MKGFEGFFLLLIKMILLPIGPYTMLPCSFKIFKADSLSSLQIDCGTLVILNFEHVTDEDEQGCWIGGTMTGGLTLLKWSIFLKGNHVIFIALKTIFFFRSTGYWQSPPKKHCSFFISNPFISNQPLECNLLSNY